MIREAARAVRYSGVRILVDVRGSVRMDVRTGRIVFVALTPAILFASWLYRAHLAVLRHPRVKRRTSCLQLSHLPIHPTSYSFTTSPCQHHSNHSAPSSPHSDGQTRSKTTLHQPRQHRVIHSAGHIAVFQTRSRITCR